VIEEYKPEDDPELKIALAAIDQVEKTVYEIVLKICNGIYEKVLKKD
jgi:hypothetical protein